MTDSLRAAIARHGAALPSPDDPVDTPAYLALLRILYAVGRADLPLGRLFEGHVDALQLVARYGSAAQREAAWASVRVGAAFGVWNADLPGESLRLTGERLAGGKAFASGAGVLSHALVTADRDGSRQLILVDLASTPPTVDRSWWLTTGMQRSETHLVRWSDAEVRPEQLVGAPDDYAREPWFTGGALRFAAVQAGGITALLDHTRDHLVKTGRAGDPHQAGRLAALFAIAEASAAAVREAAERWFEEPDTRRLAYVAAARAAVYDGGARAINLVQEAVGVQGMFLAHPLAERLSDLAVYLRQPGPDAQRMRVGAGVADGLLRSSL